MFACVYVLHVAVLLLRPKMTVIVLLLLSAAAVVVDGCRCTNCACCQPVRLASGLQMARVHYSPLGKDHHNYVEKSSACNQSIRE